MLGIEELVGIGELVGLDVVAGSGVGESKSVDGEYVGNDDSLSTAMGTYVCTGKR